MVVCYARPFTESKWFDPLGKRWRPEDASGRKLHRRLIELRNQWAAHTDEPSPRNVERFREVLWDGTNDFGELAEEAGVTNAVMMEWLSKHYVSVPAGIRREALPGILALCELQEQRFRSEWRRLEQESAGARRADGQGVAPRAPVGPQGRPPTPQFPGPHGPRKPV